MWQSRCVANGFSRPLYHTAPPADNHASATDVVVHRGANGAIQFRDSIDGGPGYLLLGGLHAIMKSLLILISHWHLRLAG